MPNKVLETDSFTRFFESSSVEEREWISKIIEQLKQNSFVGKPLGYKWFREKKYKGKRLYYLVYENSEKVLLLAFAGKKEQQAIINNVLANLERYRRIVGD
ncbi:MAG: hypothetical protein HY544_04560 [Candidatus Diapherotrites archaeon]|uniref:Type II toxin-antitoxin system RelE/ParE family toxin n=1 Tax=Candidatus Iainarchaeum sp. TaxID=3101447 RepID=A0A8T3YRI0_9ARCH|nr:hypothetical protein [Candidatus Diapherotrites archaeon]